MGKSKKNTVTRLLQDAITDAVEQALDALPRAVHYRHIEMHDNVYEIDGKLYSKEGAVEHILGKYSWYKRGIG